MRSGAAAAAALMLMASPALAAPTPYDVAFISEFTDTCVVHRTSYAETLAGAEAAGWTVASADADPELKQLMGYSSAAGEEIKAKGGSLDFAIYSKIFEGLLHFLVVSEAKFTVDDKPRHTVGCYLYNFAAATVIDPEAVGALVGEPVLRTEIDMHIASYQWAPPPKLPGTLDVYMTFVPEVSQYKDQFGFSGLVLQFNTEIPSQS